MTEPGKKDKLNRAIDVIDKAVKEVTSSVRGGTNSRVFQNWEALKKRLRGEGSTK
jgi:hypothetical protein